MLGSHSVLETDLVTEVTVFQISEPAESHENLIALGPGSNQIQSPGVASSRSCKTSAMSSSCQLLELDVALLLVTLAGLIILALLYRILLLRHKLRLAEAGNALEYFGFYHMASYSLKELDESSSSPMVTPPTTQAPSVVLVSPEVTSLSPIVTPAAPAPPPPAIPSLLPLPQPSPTPLLPLPHPIVYTTPPSPHSDGEIYSRIGTLRTSRPSSVSHTQVVLFEHSSL